MPTNAQFLGITAKFLKFNNLNFNKFKIIIWKKRLKTTLITSIIRINTSIKPNNAQVMPKQCPVMPQICTPQCPQRFTPRTYVIK